MLLSLLDPDLLIYDYAHWHNREPHCFSRFEALTLHRRMIREYDQKMGLSNELAALIYENFPWRGNFLKAEPEKVSFSRIRKSWPDSLRK